ncbi:MAG TPA: tetratricopeptide repeat protein [Thermoanaerobaculia bacterium]|jgi:tetratricopeptide (TPR) repeat protein|nr:tetratricopeptide repeat protein [Thermoanaerobaculia bacterium]
MISIRVRIPHSRLPVRLASAAAALTLLCLGGAARAQEPVDPFANPGAVTAAPSQPSGRLSKRDQQDAVQNKYRQILAAWASGQTEKAASALMALETSVVHDDDPGSRKRLLKAEEAIIHEIGGANLETLVPIAMLHHEVYRRYLQHGAKGRSLLLVHSRGMTRDLAMLYKEQSGSQGAALVSSRILTSLGGLLQQYAQQLPAAEMFYRAMDMDPRNTAAMMGLAIIYEKNSQSQSAIDMLSKILAADPAYSEARLRLALNQKRLGKTDEAQKGLQALADAKDATWVTSVAAQELARLLCEKGQLAGAQKVLEAAVHRFPDDSRMYVELASVLDRKGEMRSAQALMEKVVTMKPAAEDSSRLLYNTTRQETFAEARRFLDENAHSRLSLLAEALSVPNHATLATERVGS